MNKLDPIPAPIMLAFLLIALAVNGSIAIFGRRALRVLFFGQRAVDDASEARVVVLRIIASFVAFGVVDMLVQWAITGVAP